LATTDNLNFGNPEKPEIMGQLVGCIQGIGEACLALDMPIVSGNVSLYNETDGVGILPTPTIGAVGLLNSLDELIGIAPESGDALVLIGDSKGHLGQSALLAELFGREEGDAPKVDLEAERRAGELVRAAKAAGFLSAAHDLGDGGLALAVAEMALAANCGISVANGDAGWFFGEDQGRYLLATKEASMIIAMAESAGVTAQNVGRVQGGLVELGRSRVSLEDLREAYETGFPKIAD
jgi:phosphoribosylformylglycinamidine synthase